MANIFADGNKIITDSDINIKIFKSAQTDATKTKMSDIFPTDSSKGIFVLGIDGNSAKALTNGYYAPYLAFGVNDVRAILSVAFNTPNVRISGGNESDSWSEDIAWKSDIQRLEQEISDLKKQIGGVTSHLYAYLRKTLATSTEIWEVA